MARDILTVNAVTKTYGGGQTALSDVDLTIREGEIVALLGPNGAGKTTLISIVCGLVTPSAGTVRVGGHDIVTDYRAARRMIGLVPQEIALEPFETVWGCVHFSRGLFGLPRDDAHLERLLKQLSLWDKKDAMTRQLSGGMKRRVLIAKALAHQPRVLFLDEPTAGVDVELRKDMWATVAELKRQGVTIILTTHYIEEAEAIADRIGIISQGRILLVEDTVSLMARMGQRELHIGLAEPLDTVPAALADLPLAAMEGRLVYTYGEGTPDIGALMARLGDAGFHIVDIESRQRSLEDIFVAMVQADGAPPPDQEPARLPEAAQ